MKKINPTLLKVISILNDGQYHDGTSIGEKLNVSRTAVWKIIKKLEEYNIAISSNKGVGYCLAEPLYLLKGNDIKRNLQNKNIKIDLFESIDSTNQYLKQKYDSDIHICLSEEQTEGKGRLNREWVSPFGNNIYFSMSYLFQKDISELMGLSLVTSLAVQKTLSKWLEPLEVLIKWPNDIICDNKKISGNLIEIQAESNGFSRAIIGIGINVNMTHVKSNKITQPWTSMQNISGEIINRNVLVANLIDNLLDNLKCFENKGLNFFIDSWQHFDFLKNQKVRFISDMHKTEGIAKGISEKGYLLIEDKNGNIRNYSSGDVQLLRKC